MPTALRKCLEPIVAADTDQILTDYSFPASGTLPQELQGLFAEKKVAFVYCLVLGAGETFFIAYKSTGDGLNHCSESGSPSDVQIILACAIAWRVFHPAPESNESNELHREGSKDLPDKLQSFLFERNQNGHLVRKVDKLRVSLGPYNNSWWATDGANWKWNTLPAELNKALGQRRKPGGGWTTTPRLVSLGSNDNFILITEGGGGVWQLSSYPKLKSLVEAVMKAKPNGTFEIFHNLYLSPYRLNCFILQNRDGTTMASSLPPHVESAFTTIQAAVKEDTMQAQSVSRRMVQRQRYVLAQSAQQQYTVRMVGGPS